MIISVLTAVGLCIGFIAQMCLFWFKSLQPISFRDPFLTGLIGVVVTVYCTFTAVVYDSPQDQWNLRCKYLLGSPIACYAFFLGVPVVYRVFNIQFYYHSSESKFKNTNKDYFNNLKFLTTRKWQLIIISFFYLLAIMTAILIHFAVEKDRLPTNYQECIGWNLLGFAIQTTPLTIGFAILILKFIHFRDPFGIKFEFTCGLIVSSLGIPLFLIFQAVDILHKPFHSDDFQPFLITWAISLAYYLISVLSPLYYAYSNERKLLRSSSQTQITLETILDNPAYLESFKKQVTQFWCSEALLFMIEVKEFRSLSPDRMKERAHYIIKEYITEGSDNQININKADNKEIISSFQSGEIYGNLFDAALRDVQDQLLPILIRWKQEKKYEVEGHSDNNIVPLKPISG